MESEDTKKIQGEKFMDQKKNSWIIYLVSSMFACHTADYVTASRNKSPALSTCSVPIT